MQNITIRRDLKLKFSLLWLKRAFITFREKPLHFLILEIFTSVFSLLPFLGAFMSIIFMGRFMYCANKVADQMPFTIGQMFKSLFSNKILLRLAFLNFSLNTAILLAQYLADVQFQNTNSISPNIFTLFLAIPTLVLSVSMWLAPALCLFNSGLEPKGAMWFSLKVCFHNILVLLAYLVLVAGISLIVLLPLLLILLKLWSMTHSLYIIIPIAIVAYLISLIWFAILNISTYYVYSFVFKRDTFSYTKN